jgi:hypothetical protein
MMHVNTRPYEAVHGHKPRQPLTSRVSRWAFQLDDDPDDILFITAKYRDARRTACGEAKRSITVLPYPAKEPTMKHGHVTGNKRERRPSNFYYQSEECAALLAQLDADEAAKQTQQAPQHPKDAA